MTNDSNDDDDDDNNDRLHVPAQGSSLVNHASAACKYLQLLQPCDAVLSKTYAEVQSESWP